MSVDEARSDPFVRAVNGLGIVGDRKVLADVGDDVVLNQYIRREGTSLVLFIVRRDSTAFKQVDRHTVKKGGVVNVNARQTD